ncbi:MAG TPA: peptide MFS transporter [Candidatus Acidoferrales bacterium]|nr:peptide MFS transporter [Candidatus Acidoferrales bacterium]
MANHPRGIYTLYFTEMWERMSYYGMRAILILYMVAGAANGGLGLDEATAGAIYGLYTCAVYLVALPGGWIADRLIGPQRAVLIGGIIIALGHFTLAIPNQHTFFVGLLIVVLGTSLLKPNASALVGKLYPEGGARRDAGFTLFYMGVNLGGLIGPLVCGYFGEHVNWHYGFAAAGVGMVLGVIQYVLTRHHLGTAGLEPSAPTKTPRREWAIVAVGLGVILVVAVLALTGCLVINPVLLAKRAEIVIVTAAGLWFLWAFLFGRLDRVEKKRLLVVVILFFASALFWSGFEQAGSVMNLFAERHTDRVLFGREMPASWYQSINPLLILVLAVPVSTLWLGLAKRSILPSLAIKFSAGLLMLAAGFLVMYFAARHALSIGKVTGLWLCTTYLLQTIGELFLSPVGLSAVTKLAPARLASQTMGVWFLSVSLGNLIAGMFAGGMSTANAAGMPAQFLHVALFAGGAGLLLLLLSPLIRRLMPGIE